MFRTLFDIASSAMSANRLRINTIASNLANANTTRAEDGKPYRRRDVVFAAADVPKDKFSSALDEATLKTVRVEGVKLDDKPPMLVYDPGHPDADPKTGMVAMPNVNPVTEMVNMMGASAAYKAAAEIVTVTKDMASAVRTMIQRM